MSKYTTQLRWVVEQEERKHDSTPAVGYYHAETYSKLGLDKYPIFNEAYRQELNDKIINHYYFREIGFETVAQFAWYVRQKMWEIMPYYNQLYKSLDLITDPLTNQKLSYTEYWANENARDWSNNGSNTNDGTSTNHSSNIFQDTPMSLLTDEPYSVSGLDYATNVTYNNSNATSSDKGTNEAEGVDNSKGKGTKTHEQGGYNVSQSELLKKYRETFLNVDMQIIEDLATLFMGIY